jgi:hypothetical protein
MGSWYEVSATRSSPTKWKTDSGAKVAHEQARRARRTDPWSRAAPGPTSPRLAATGSGAGAVPAKRSRTREGRSVGPEGVPDRKYDVSQLTVDELERTRRDLEVSLALITPGAYPGAP